MGLFSQGQNGGGGFNWENAILSFFGAGPQVQAAQTRRLQRQRLEAELAEQQREAQTRESQIWGAKELGYSPAQIGAMTPADISQLARANFEPRQYGPTGGSTAYTNPDGSVRYEQAPWRQEVGRSIVGAGENGADQRVIYRGQEIVPVPNVGAFGATDLGLIDPDAPPQMGFLPREQAPAVQGVGPQIPQAPQTSAAPDIPRVPPAALLQPSPQEAPAFAPAPPGATSEFGPVQFGNPLDPSRPPITVTRPPRSARPSGNSRAAQLRAQARRAIQQGRDPNAVRARLRQMGVSDAGL